MSYRSKTYTWNDVILVKRSMIGVFFVFYASSYFSCSRHLPSPSHLLHKFPRHNNLENGNNRPSAMLAIQPRSCLYRTCGPTFYSNFTYCMHNWDRLFDVYNSQCIFLVQQHSSLENIWKTNGGGELRTSTHTYIHTYIQTNRVFNLTIKIY